MGWSRHRNSKTTVAALLPNVNTQKDHFKAQEIANLLWAIAMVGEFIETPAVFITTLVKEHVLNELTIFSELEMRIALWGLLVVGARQFLCSLGASVVEPLEQLMRVLFEELKKRMLYVQKDCTIMAMAAFASAFPRGFLQLPGLCGNREVISGLFVSAVAESLFHTLKTVLVYQRRFQ